MRLRPTYDAMCLTSSRDFDRNIQGSRGSGGRESRTAPSTGLLRQMSQATEAPAGRSLLVGVVGSVVIAVARRAGAGEAGDGSHVASQGLSVALAMKESAAEVNTHADQSEIRKLIEEMAQTNVGWGAPRIHGELRKLGIRVSEATVSRYMPKRPAPPGSGQRWSAFLANHLRETLAIDFAVVPTITFGLMYVFFVLSLDRRRILHFNVTKHPTASWTAHQVVQACDFETPGRYLLRDNDSIYGQEFRQRIERLGLEQIRTALRSPWQNGYAERWVGSLRRDCLDHVIAINERQLRCVIREYVEYYHADRTHLGLDKDTPDGREFEPPEVGKIVALPRVGGLHHRYTRRAA